MKLRSLLLLPLIALAPAVAHADALDVKTIPADAKWVLHLDTDALIKTQTWTLLEPRLQKNPEFTKGVANIERIFAAKFPQDLHDITLFGPGFDPKSAVVIVHANVDQERLKTLLSVNDTYSSQVIGGYTIHGWVDKGKQLYGGFADGNRLVVSQTPASIASTLDTLAGKIDPIKNDELLGGTKDAGIIAYVAGSQLAKLAEMGLTQNPFIGKFESAWLNAGETDAGVHLKAHLVADDETVAQNISKAIEGLKAALSFADRSDPQAARAADLADSLSIKRDGKQLDMDMVVPMDMVGQMIQSPGRWKENDSQPTTAP